ncbi:hypothetical protein B7463_g2012, partial [Scytalidium lignicola]
MSTIDASKANDMHPATPRNPGGRQENLAQSWNGSIASSFVSRTPFENAELLQSQVRKHTPIRAMFDDLPTAHSSITSGSARSGCRIYSSPNGDVPEKGSLILQGSSTPGIVKERINHDDEFSQPLKGVHSNCPNGSLGEFSSQPKNFVTSTTFSNVTYTSHGSISDHSVNDTPSPMRMDDSKPGNTIGSDELTCINDLSSEELQVTGDFQPSSNQQSLIPYTTTNEPASPLEGTTLGNLYTRYMQYDSHNDPREFEEGHQVVPLPIEETGLSSSYRDDYDRGCEFSDPNNGTLLEAKTSKPSAHHAQTQGRSERLMMTGDHASRAALSNLQFKPGFAGSNNLYGSEMLDYPSSYGNTQSLLAVNSGNLLPENTPGMRILNNSMTSQPAARNQLPITSSQSALTSNNPFRSTSARPANGSMNVKFCPSNEDRAPLERDISSVLRRVSTYSAFSEDSMDSYEMLGEGLNLQSSTAAVHDRSLPVTSRDKSLKPRGTGSDEGDISNVSENSQVFYQHGAVAPSWVSSQHQNTVRVPIFYDAYFPDSPPTTPFSQPYLADKEDVVSYDQDDGNGDWETVGDSITQSGLQSSHSVRGIYRGAVKQAGSSLANISDEGSLSFHPNMEQFRFPPEGHRHTLSSQSYRQRGLKETRMPIFPPVRRAHRVNGYLGRSGSSPNRHMRRPRPLKRHTNPFRSPPPNVSTFSTFDTSDSTTYTHRFSGHKNRNHFPCLGIMASSAEDKDITEQGIPLQDLPSALTTTSHIANWIDESEEYRTTTNMLGQALPTVRHAPAKEELTSQDIGDATHNHYPTITANNNADSTDSLLIEHTPLETGARAQAKPYGSVQRVASSGHAQRVKGPPGALYRNIRSTSEQRRLSRVQAHNNAGNSIGQAGANENAINTGRPFSLLNSGPSPTLDSMAPRQLLLVHEPSSLAEVSQTMPVTRNNQSYGFPHRSPPGPPRSTEWQMLYTDAQLQKMRDDAKAAGVYDSQATLTPAIAGQSPGRAPRTIRTESPHLYRVRRGIRDPEVVQRGRKISIIALCLCNLFPPLLLLYATGHLDGIMLWWSEGKFDSFARGQKKAAYWLTSVWVISTIIGVACGIFYVVFSRRATSVLH